MLYRGVRIALPRTRLLFAHGVHYDAKNRKLALLPGCHLCFGVDQEGSTVGLGVDALVFQRCEFAWAPTRFGGEAYERWHVFIEGAQCCSRFCGEHLADDR